MNSHLDGVKDQKRGGNCEKQSKDFLSLDRLDAIPLGKPWFFPVRLHQNTSTTYEMRIPFRQNLFYCLCKNKSHKAKHSLLLARNPNILNRPVFAEVKNTKRQRILNILNGEVISEVSATTSGPEWAIRFTWNNWKHLAPRKCSQQEKSDISGESQPQFRHAHFFLHCIPCILEHLRSK